VNGSKKEKSQGIKGSANANDMWVWMMSHIGFCTMGKCGLLSFFLLIESLSAACKFHPLFCTWSSSYEVSPLLLFNPCSLLFFGILLFAGKRFHSLEFSRRITW
jgi:hypothetical protein